MKKIVLVSIVTIAALLLNGFTSKASNEEPMYYFVMGYETSKSNKNLLVFVSNVVYVNCSYHNSNMVENQSRDYYNAFYTQSRNAIVGKIIASRFDSRDKAENQRRILIASYNNRGFDILHMRHFSVLCVD